MLPRDQREELFRAHRTYSLDKLPTSDPRVTLAQQQKQQKQTFRTQTSDPLATLVQQQEPTFPTQTPAQGSTSVQGLTSRKRPFNKEPNIKKRQKTALDVLVQAANNSSSSKSTGGKRNKIKSLKKKRNSRKNKHHTQKHRKKKQKKKHKPFKTRKHHVNKQKRKYKKKQSKQK